MAIISFPQIRLGRTLQSQNTQGAHGFLSPDFLTVTIRTGCETMHGHWWYDQNVPRGTPDPSVNADMISPAFWLASGNDFKITRSDDSSHIPLLRTKNNCLGGQTFRSKITSYGDFRNGTVWSNDACLGRCMFSMLVSTIQQTGLIWLGAMVICKPATRSASGVTGVLVMGPS